VVCNCITFYFVNYARVNGSCILHGNVGRLLDVFGSRGASGTSDLLVSCREGFAYHSDLVYLALEDPLGDCVHYSFTTVFRNLLCTFGLVLVFSLVIGRYPLAFKAMFFLLYNLFIV
jgi:hypothetical protein